MECSTPTFAGQSRVIALDGKTLCGTIDAYVPHITQEMYLAAAETIAAMTSQGELMPNPLDKGVHRAVAKKAIEQGLARAPDDADDLRDLFAPPGNRLEALHRDREGQYSVRINDQYRICFKWLNGKARDVEITDYH